MSGRGSMERNDKVSNQGSPFRQESPYNTNGNTDHHRDRSRSRSKGRERKYSRSSRDRGMDEYPQDSNGRTGSSRGRGGSRERSPMSGRRRHIAPRDAAPPGRCLGVFGLSIYTQEKDLKELLGKFGPIEDVQIVYDAQTGRSRGFAFVYFEREDDAAEAKERCNGTEVDGRKIRVDFSITQRAHTPTPGIYMGKPTQNRTGRDRDGRPKREERYDSRHEGGGYRRPRDDYGTARPAPYDYHGRGRDEYARPPPRSDPYDAYGHSSRPAPPPPAHYEDRYRDTGYAPRRRSPSPYSSYARPSSSRGAGYRERSRSYSPRRYTYY